MVTNSPRQSRILQSLDSAAAANLSSLPRARVLFLVSSCFSLYGATYTVPSLLPFAASAYQEIPGGQQQLLLWMQVLQNLGDVSGRVLAPQQANPTPLERLAVSVCSSTLSVCFIILVFAAAKPSLLPLYLPYTAGQVLLPLLCFCFYFARGLLVVWLYGVARRLTTHQATAESLASTMGLCGQIGALTANGAAFVLVVGCGALGN
mmetsp:Transcript_96002/g.220096  ORF Transcript_96002/g.220096 Transcript_96002/m.220096 type:complete len:206 (-) Transcript_96002:74-691(-)